MSDKIIKDPIYGYVKIPPLCLSYIDLPIFQRLRRVKQLGNVNRVYPPAIHSRFEHSIGVMHLAGEMCKVLKIKGWLKTLIQLAGLVHDMGHMPYSHLFDLILKINKAYHNLPIDHEDRSIHLFQEASKEVDTLTEDEILFVCQCIKGEPADRDLMLSDGTIISNKDLYLYQIVSGKVDMDRNDYIQRDSYHTGMPTFQVKYIILNARIHPVTRALTFREKAKEDIRKMFETRTRLHKLVYQHSCAQKYDTLYICMLSTLFQEGEMDKILSYSLCDYQLDTFLMNHPLTSKMYEQMERRQHDHSKICLGKDHPIQTKYIESFVNWEDNIMFVK